MSKYNPTEYLWDGGISVLLFPILPVFLTVAAVVGGFLLSFVGQWIYLIVLWPAFAGFLIFLAGIAGAKWAKMRSMSVGVVLGMASGVLCMGVMHYCDYLRAIGEAPQPDPRLATFWAFMHAQATEGVSIGKNGWINLGFTGSWIYWILEVLGVGVIAFGGVAASLGEPFCRRCQSWKKARELGTVTGKAEEVTELVKQGDVDALVDLDPTPKAHDLVLTAHVCPTCQDDVDITIKLEEKYKNEKGEEQKKEHCHLTYPGEALADFEDVFGKAMKRKKKAKRPAEDDDDEY